MKNTFRLLTAVLMGVTACNSKGVTNREPVTGQAQIKTGMQVPANAVQELNKIKALYKFGPTGGLYTGVYDPEKRAYLSKQIDGLAGDFIAVLEDEPTEKKFREKMAARLETIGRDYDTEDRERICDYFEACMDAVGLTSSEGLLNKYLYGFDPSSLKQQPPFLLRRREKQPADG